MLVLVGTSGWQYADWRGDFYPAGLPDKQWLEYYATVFSSVEINNAFYRLPEHSTFATWRDRTPTGFTFSVKASRFLTHIKRLRDPAEPVARLIDRARGLGDKLGPILLQLPPTLRIDLSALEETLSCFPRDVRVAVEPRHSSWFVDDTRELLVHHGAALCFADSPGLHTPRWRTSNWGYVRFHEGRANPPPCYGQTALHSWAVRLGDLFEAGSEVYAYFNNDTHACAPHDAIAFARILEDSGLLDSPPLLSTPRRVANDRPENDRMRSTK